MRFPYLYPRLSWRRLLQGLLQRPGFTMQMIVEERPWRRALVALAASGAGFWLGIGVSLFAGGRPWQAASLVTLVGMASWPVVLAALAGAYRFSARVLDSHGDWRSLYVGMSFGALPMALFIAPALLLTPLGGFGAGLVPLIGAGLILWTLVLWAFAVRESQGMITEFAFIVLAMPLTFLFLAILATALSVGIGALIVGSF